jgi:hypothetical protein
MRSQLRVKRQPKRAGVMAQVVIDHTGHEEIAVVVALVHGERKRLTATRSRVLEVVRPPLLLEEGIG